MNKNKDFIPVGIKALDALMTNGIPKGKLNMIMSSPKLGKSDAIVTFAPTEEPNQYLIKMPISDVPNEIIESGCSFIIETLDWLKENNFKVPKPPLVKYEKFGDTVFPVTYHENGMITLDYPPESLKYSNV